MTKGLEEIVKKMYTRDVVQRTNAVLPEQEKHQLLVVLFA